MIEKIPTVPKSSEVPRKSWSVEDRAWLVVLNLGGPNNPHYLYYASGLFVPELSKATRFTSFDLAYPEMIWWKEKGYRDEERIPYYQTASMLLEPIAGGIS